MFTRCVKRDQWDWHTVYVVLGQPPLPTIRKLSTAFGEASQAVRRDGASAVLPDLLQEQDVLLMLENAERDIASSGVRLNEARQHRSKRTRAREPDSQERILSSYQKAKLDAARNTHERTLDILSEALSSGGHRVEANQFVDAFTSLKSGPAIFEVKSINDKNELSQIRSAISQLYEYRFRHGIEDASLWIVLSQATGEDWVVSYLEEDRDIRMLWVESEELTGPSLGRLFESGSASLAKGRGI